RLTRQRRVARREHQSQHVVVDRLPLVLAGLVEVAGERPVPLVEAFAAPPGVDRAALGHGREPGARIARNALLRPRLKRLDDRFLRQFFGEADVAGHPGQRGDHAGALDPPDRLDRAPQIRLAVHCCSGHSVPSSWRHWTSFLRYSLSAYSAKSSISFTRRTSSLAPGPSGARLAHSAASSLLATWMIQNPLNSSWVSP